MFQPDARFLVVDDSKVVRDMIRTSLSQLGYKNLDEATNGKIGLQKITASISEKQPYTLVFCDINMPEMDGLQLLEKIRSEPLMAHLPVLMITTEGEKPTVIKAVMAGVSGYMVKPFGVEDVKKKLREVYGRLSVEHKSAGE